MCCYYERGRYVTAIWRWFATLHMRGECAEKCCKKKFCFVLFFGRYGGKRKGGAMGTAQVSIMITLASRWAKASRITVTFFAMILNPPRESGRR